MPQHDDELNKRREKREALRKKREAEQKRLKITLILAAVILLAAGAGILFMAKNAGVTFQKPEKPRQEIVQTEAPTEAPTQATEKSAITTIHIRAAGDLNITDTVVNAGIAATGYNSTRAFQDVASNLADADLTVLNLEGNICGEPFGSGRTSGPQELLDSLRSAGVDILQTANSASINNGLIGLTSTLSSVRHAGLEPIGAYASAGEFQQTKGYTICNVQGIKIAFVAFTKGVGGMGMPAGNEDCVNLLYEDYDSNYKKIDKAAINGILDAVAQESPDFTVAMLHWGSEFNEAISKTQEDIVALMQKKGVDLILGTHPHLVQKIDFNKSAGTLVAYSLGDFFGDAVRAGTNYSIVLDVEITKDADLGTTRVTDFSFTPIYTLHPSQCQGDYSYSRVVRIEEAMLAYENNFVDKISKAAYDDMLYSLERIDARIYDKDNQKDTAKK